MTESSATADRPAPSAYRIRPAPRFWRRGLLAALALAAFTLFWGLPFVVSPLSSDEAFYALGGRVVFEGGSLYSDFWDIKPPLVYLIHVPLAPLAEHSAVLRVFHLAASLLSVGAVYLLGRRFFSERAAFIGAALYSFSFFALADYLALGEAESFMIAPLALAFTVYRGRDGALLRPLAAGSLLGIVVAFKLSAIGLVLGLPAFEYLLRKPGWTVSGAVRRLSLAAAGFLAVQAAWAGYLVADGAWSDFVDIQRSYTIPYSELRWPPDVYVRTLMQATADWLRNASYLTLPAWGAILLVTVRGGLRPAVRLLALLVGLCLLSIWWQGKMFQYHWLILLPFLAALAGYACDAVLKGVRPLGQRSTQLTAALLLSTFVVLALTPLLHTYDAYLIFADRLTGRATALEVENRYHPEFGFTRELIDYIEANSTEEETFLIYGLWTVPYLELDRDFPTRFIASHALRATWTPEKWQREFMSDLRQTLPRFVIVSGNDIQPWLTGTLEATDDHFCFGFPELRQFVDASYRAVLNNGLFVLYDREAAQHLVEPRCPP